MILSAFWEHKLRFDKETLHVEKIYTLSQKLQETLEVLFKECTSTFLSITKQIFICGNVTGIFI